MDHKWKGCITFHLQSGRCDLEWGLSCYYYHVGCLECCFEVRRLADHDKAFVVVDRENDNRHDTQVGIAATVADKSNIFCCQRARFDLIWFIEKDNYTLYLRIGSRPISKWTLLLLWLLPRERREVLRSSCLSVCLFVCLSLHSHVSKTACTNITKFTAHATGGCRSVLV